MTSQLLYTQAPIQVHNQAKRIKRTGIWTTEEHCLYLQAIKKLRGMPWKTIAEYIGTRTVRQVLTHHQKYLRKVKRHAKSPSDEIHTREEHAVDLSVLTASPRRRRRLSIEMEASTTSESDWESCSNSSVTINTMSDTLLDQDIYGLCDPTDTIDIDELLSFMEKADAVEDMEMSDEELVQGLTNFGFFGSPLDQCNYLL